MDLSTLAAMPVPSPMRPSMICSTGVGGGVSTCREALGDPRGQDHRQGLT